jgi:enoyl-CoA hydratase/carnithine racemase
MNLAETARPEEDAPHTPGHVWCARSGAHGAVATVWLSHPGRHNAISVAMWRELADLFRRLAGDQQLRAVVVRGEAGAFAAGADISEFSQVRATRDQVIDYHERVIGDALRAILQCPAPVVAAIDGPCIGGGLEIAAVCDLRIASDRSRFGIPIGRLGFPVAPFEAACLVSVIGRANTLELLLEGRLWSAEEALAKGVVNRVHTRDDWENEVEAAVGRIIASAPHAARRNKWLVQLLTRVDDQAAMTEGQRQACWDFVDMHDYARGLDAFLTKTRPQFQHD